ncbi:MAG: IS110 family transposase [Acetobacteraceae bacterium]|nr:IS110 family transposase [Acetobacteraceae bacterium]
MTTWVGGDVSKGYLDLFAVDDTGQQLKRKLYDIPRGHSELCNLFANWSSKGEVVFGVEATGGFERNWLATACQQREAIGLTLEVYQVNPLAVSRFRSADLHRNVTDELSAVAIVEFLRSKKKPKHQYYSPVDDGVVVLYRLTCDAISLVARQKTQLLQLLGSTVPELVQHARGGPQGWLLALLSRFGTARQIAEALPADLEPYVADTIEAKELIAAAKTSVAALKSDAAAAAVKSLVLALQSTQARVDRMKADVVKFVQQRPEMKRMKDIPGLGEWTCAVILLEVGNLDRFPTAASITAFVGLNPKVHDSGDKQKRMHISRNGSARVRGALFMPTLVAIKCNAAIKAFYERLTNECGKPKKLAIVAAMRKLLIQAWACGRSIGKPFDVAHEARRREEQKRKPQPKQQPQTVAARAVQPPQTIDPAAPVSRRALIRSKRKAAIQSHPPP